MGAIKAIETEYKGHLFRSRLEARWAVFFESLGIEWEYETEGFELPSGQRYLPDFHLPKHQLWVEVKGSEDDLRGDGAKLAEAAMTLKGNGLMLLGPVPDPGDGLAQHFILTPEEHCCGKTILCLHIAWADMLVHPEAVLEVGFPCTDLKDRREQVLPALKGYGRGRATYLNPGQIPEWHDFPPGTAAYRAARSARFEHGQSGAML